MEKLLVHGSIILICLCTLEKQRKLTTIYTKRKKEKLQWCQLVIFLAKLKFKI